MSSLQPQQDPPHGSENYDQGGIGDIGALNPNQQMKLNAFKVSTYGIHFKTNFFIKLNAVKKLTNFGVLTTFL